VRQGATVVRRPRGGRFHPTLL